MKKIIAFTILTLISFNSFANDNAKKVIELIIKDEIDIFSQGGKARLNNYIPIVNASQLISKYKNNQYKYEKEFDNQIVNIKTRASGVKTDLFGDAYVEANGNNEFEYVSLELKNKDDAININKGDKIDMICVGTKNNIIFPTLENCVTTDSYFQKFLKVTMKDINKLKKNAKPRNMFEFYYLILWEIEIKNPGKLDKFKTISEVQEFRTVIEEIATDLSREGETLWKSYPEETIKKLGEFRMPKP